jgi:hypothetical protein
MTLFRFLRQCGLILMVLQALSNYGDKNVTALVLERLNDLNHLVRRKSVSCSCRCKLLVSL